MIAKIKEFHIPLYDNNTLIIHNESPMSEINTVFAQIVHYQKYLYRIDTELGRFGEASLSSKVDMRTFKVNGSRTKIHIHRDLVRHKADIHIILPILKGKLCKNNKIQIVFTDDTKISLNDYMNLVEMTLQPIDEYEFTKKIVLDNNIDYLTQIIKYFICGTNNLVEMHIALLFND